MGKLVLMTKHARIWLMGITLMFGHLSSVRASPIGPDFTDVSSMVLPTTVHIRIERGPLISAGIQQMARDYALPVPRHDSQSVR